jgi:hypothetical protein
VIWLIEPFSCGSTSNEYDVKKRGVGDFESWRTSDGGIAKSLSVVVQFSFTGEILKRPQARLTGSLWYRIGHKKFDVSSRIVVVHMEEAFGTHTRRAPC